MIRTILAFFGYVKIPLEAVQLSILQEDIFKSLIKVYPENKQFEQGYKAAKTLTEFLRSGKSLS